MMTYHLCGLMHQMMEFVVGVPSTWSIGPTFQWSTCTGCNLSWDHNTSTSTTTWEKGGLIRRSLLLCVRVHPQLHCTHHQQLLHRAHQIETDVELRDHSSCELSCVVPLYLLPSSHSTCVLFAEKSWPDYGDIFWSKLKDWTQSMQDAIPHHGFYVIKLHIW